MSDPTPLDPDEVPCPKCGSPAAVPCRTAGGRRARSIHTERRRAADPSTPPVTRPAGQPFGDRERAVAAGKKSAQARRRRRAEQDAAIAAATEKRLREEAEANAVRLAEDAVRYANDRAILKRHTLDAASLAYSRLIESLEGLQRLELDDDGRPKLEPRETLDRSGNRVVKDVPVLRGAYTADTVEKLAKVAASSLLSLRLEEEKPTGISRNEGDAGGAAGILGEAGVDELLEWAAKNLPRDGAS